MNSDEAFLQAIAETPDDDAPRLIYADWLDDHGQADRATFIRVQCALARREPGDPDRPRLQAEEKRTRGAAEKARPSLRGIHWGSFSRGFVQDVSARTPGVFRKHLQRIQEVAPITMLGFREGLTDAALRALFKERRLPLLRNLELGGQRSLGPEAARALAHCPRLCRLATLSLYMNRLGDEGVIALAASPWLGQLRTLNIHSNGVGTAGAEAIAASETLGGLIDLHLGDPIGPGGAIALARSPHLKRLINLTLQDGGIGAAGAVALAESSNLAALASLQIRDQIGAEGGRALASSPHLMQLTSLILFRCRLGDEGARALSVSPILKGITHLNLCGNDLGDESAIALARSPFLEGLEKRGLVLHNNPRMTERGERILRERFGNEKLSNSLRHLP